MYVTEIDHLLLEINKESIVNAKDEKNRVGGKDLKII
jgi:hypothetical protein